MTTKKEDTIFDKSEKNIVILFKEYEKIQCRKKIKFTATKARSRIRLGGQSDIQICKEKVNYLKRRYVNR
jgi:hypothetical protein